MKRYEMGFHGMLGMVCDTIRFVMRRGSARSYDMPYEMYEMMEMHFDGMLDF